MKSSHRRGSSTARGLVLSTAFGLLAVSAGAEAPNADEEDSDLLRFRNGDSLHGTFQGMGAGPVVRWNHSDARDPIVLDPDKLRRIAFSGGRPRKALAATSFVSLAGGDRIPGRIVSLDDKALTIETEMAGVARIPREFVSHIAPNPHGGTVHYIGPFSDGEWEVIENKVGKKEDEDAAAEKEKENADDEKAKDDAPEEDEQEEEGPWVFSGGAYYSNSQLPIALDAGIPDQTRIRFTLGWRNRLNAAIAFHATLAPPEEDAGEDKEGEKKPAPRQKVQVRQAGSTASFATTYGHSYVLTIYSNYAQLYRCDFNEDGAPELDRLSTSSSNLRLEETGESEFELRCDREAGSITLFAGGRYVSQWEDTRGYAGTGSHLAFACQSSTSRLRVSDVVVTSWNGMIDSAQSMEVEDRDIVLLTNGTDRFSGEVTSLQDGTFEVKGTYATMQVPLERVQEIRLARGGISEIPEPEEDAVRLILPPVGRLTVVPDNASSTTMKARHPAMGELQLDLRYAGLLEFSFGDSVLDSWDEDF